MFWAEKEVYKQGRNDNDVHELPCGECEVVWRNETSKLIPEIWGDAKRNERFVIFKEEDEDGVLQVRFLDLTLPQYWLPRYTTGSCRWKCSNTSRPTSRQPYWTTSIVLPDMVSYSAGRYLVKVAFITSTTDLQHTSTRLCSTEDSQWIRRLLLTCVKQRLLLGLKIT